MNTSLDWFRIILSELGSNGPARAEGAVSAWMMPVLLVWASCSTEDGVTNPPQVTPVVSAASSTVTPQGNPSVADVLDAGGSGVSHSAGSGSALGPLLRASGSLTSSLMHSRITRVVSSSR
jgi:hypothetical protein